MNIDAPIVPGESAAGIQLGSSIEELLNAHKNSFSSGEILKYSHTITRYRSAMVDVWVRKGKHAPIKEIYVVSLSLVFVRGKGARGYASRLPFPHEKW